MHAGEPSGVHGRESHVPHESPAPRDRLAPRDPVAPREPAGPREALTGPVPQVMAQEAHAAWQAGVPIVDVREAAELAAARVPGVLHVPFSTFRERWEEVPRDGPVVIMCHSGGRSNAAARWLRSHGIDARNLAHGIVAWADAGLPLDTGGA